MLFRHTTPTRLFFEARCALLVSALLCACSTAVEDVQESTSEPAPSEVSKAGTAQERRTRLNREADIRAGLDPDAPLPRWKPIKGRIEPEREAVPTKPCKVGDLTRLKIERAGKTVREETLDDLLAGDAVITPELDSKHTVKVLSVARLVSRRAKSVQVVSCDGSVTEIPAGTLSEDAAWVLMRNKKGHLKLLDWQTARVPTKPEARRVTVLRQR